MKYFGHGLLHWLLTHMIVRNQGCINHVPEYQALFSYLKIETNKQTNKQQQQGREGNCSKHAATHKRR